MIQRSGLWPMRVVWLILPACLAPAFGDALAEHSQPVRLMALTLAWACWAGTLLALLIPRSLGLTLLRLVAPAGLALAVWIGLDGDVTVGLRLLALVAALVSLLVAFLPSTGEQLVDGSSYGDEHRVLLRAPLALYVGPLPLAWALLAGGALGGPLLLAARQWIAGAVVTAAAAAVGWMLVIRFHQLSRRWLVFVPAGVVVHDPLTLADPVLFPRRLVRGIAPAPLENTALDLTGGAAGLALELTAVDPVVVAPVRAGEDLTSLGVLSVLVTPTRPGHTLRIAQSRRLPVA